MSTLKIEEKQVVVPGEVLAEGMDFLPSRGTYRDKDMIIASRVGVANVSGKVIKVIPLSGGYLPKVGDTIIGKVFDITLNGWRLEINSAYSAMLSLRDASSDFINRGVDLTRYFTFGDYMLCNITQVTSQYLTDVTMKGPGLRKLTGGRVIKVTPTKVPRIVGKQGSMISMVKRATRCNIFVGQNGLIWLQGEPKDEIIAEKTIRKIEAEAQFPGLTDRIKAFLEEQYGNKDLFSEGLHDSGKEKNHNDENNQEAEAYDDSANE